MRKLIALLITAVLLYCMAPEWTVAQAVSGELSSVTPCAVIGVKIEGAVELLKGASYTLVWYVQCDGEDDDQSVAFASSDDNVVTVDAHGVITGVAQGVATVTVTTVVGGFTADCRVAVIDVPPEPEINRTEINHTMYTYGYGGAISMFSSDNPAEYTQLATMPAGGWAMEYYDGAVYCHSFMGNTYRIDNLDFENPVLLDYIDNDDFMSMGMAFNYTNATMYEIGIDMYGDNYLVQFDMLDGNVEAREYVTDYNSWLLGLAITTDGIMLTYDSYSDTLCQINPRSFEPEELFRMGINSEICLYYNHNEGILYACNASGDLYTVDIDTQTVTHIGSLCNDIKDITSAYTHEVFEPIPATGIIMDVNTLSLGFGQTDYVAPKVLPVGATDRTYTISSSNEGIVSVDAAGNLIAGNTAGVAIITAVAADGGFIATCTVTVSELGDLGEAVNVEGGTLKFNTTHDYPWTVAEIDGRTVAMTTDSEEFPTESYILTYSHLDAGDYISFDFKAEVDSRGWVSFDVFLLNMDTTEQAMIYHSIDLATMNEWTSVCYQVNVSGNYRILFVMTERSLASVGSTVSIDNVFVGAILAATEITLPESTQVDALFHSVLDWSVEPYAAMLLGDFEFTSSDESVVTVDTDGLLFGVAEGTAIVTITGTTSGLSDSCIVTVNPEPACTRLYGFGVTDDGSVLMSLANVTAEDYYTLHDYDGIRIVAAEYLGGVVYGYTDDNRFFTAQYDDMGSLNIADTATAALSNRQLAYWHGR